MQARTPALHLGPRRPRLHIPCWLPPSFPPCACTAPAPTEPLLLWLPLAQQTWLSDVAEKQREAAKSDDAQGRDAACREGDPCPIAGGSGIFLRLQSNASYCCLSPNLVAAPPCPTAWPGGARRQLTSCSRLSGPWLKAEGDKRAVLSPEGDVPAGPCTSRGEKQILTSGGEPLATLLPPAKNNSRSQLQGPAGNHCPAPRQPRRKAAAEAMGPPSQFPSSRPAASRL